MSSYPRCDPFNHLQPDGRLNDVMSFLMFIFHYLMGIKGRLININWLQSGQVGEQECVALFYCNLTSKAPFHHGRLVLFQAGTFGCRCHLGKIKSLIFSDFVGGTMDWLTERTNNGSQSQIMKRILGCGTNYPIFQGSIQYFWSWLINFAALDAASCSQTTL